MDLRLSTVLIFCFCGHITSKKIVPDDFLLFTDFDKHSIYYMDISTKIIQEIATKNVSGPVTVDYDYHEGRIIWADSYRHEINSIFKNGSYQKNILRATDNSLLYGLAIDSEMRLLFYADTGKREIAKMKMDDSKITVLINTFLQRPRDIIIDSLKRRLYWTNWGIDAKIETSDYDGTNRRTVINRGLRRPFGIALDHRAGVIYWCDAGNENIEKSSIDGTNRQLVHSAPGSILNGIALYGDIIFYVQSRNHSIMSVSTNGSEVKTFGPSIFSNLFSIHVFFVNECRSFPCLNNGSCTDDYLCTCETGFTGVRCEKDIDDCQSLPCLNNGSCTDTFNDYNCTCETGFTGVRCENDIDDCQSLPCLNNGSCTDAVNNYICTCETGFTGVRCRTDIDDCQSLPCLNNGSCTDAVNYYICNCETGFTGVRCETDIDDCQSLPCLNNGSCTDAVYDYICTCETGFTGVRCETEVAMHSEYGKNYLITGIITATVSVVVVVIFVVAVSCLVKRKIHSNTKSTDIHGSDGTGQELQRRNNEKDKSHDDQAYMNVDNKERNSSQYDKPLNDVGDCDERHYSVIDEESTSTKNSIYDIIDSFENEHI